MAKQAKQRSKQSTASSTKPQTVTPAMALAELRKHADQGDPEAQAALMRWLDRNPAIWRQIGDLAHHSQAELIRLVGKSDFVLTESIKRRMAEQRAELLGVFPTPLETLAVDRLIAARMHLEHVEAQCAKAEGEIPLAKFWLARQRQAHNLYHNAVKSLLLVRELLPAAAPPAALAANGTPTAKLNGNGRFAIGVNGDGSSLNPATGPAKQINGAAKNGKHRALATT